MACEKLKPKLKTVLDECVSELQCGTQNKNISKTNLQTLTTESTEELDNEKRNNERKIIKKIVS